MRRFSFWLAISLWSLLGFMVLLSKFGITETRHGAPMIDAIPFQGLVVPVSGSDKQLDFIENAKYSYNIASGSIRSGKTFAQIWKLIDFLESGDALPGVDGLMIGKTSGALKTNIINDLLDIYKRIGRESELEHLKSEGVLYYHPKHIRINLVGAYDEKSEGRIRGMTAQFLVGDEVSLWPQVFFQMAMGRVSAGKRYKWLTTNPDAPSHYLMTRYINNPKLAGKLKVWYFGLDDNPVLDADYKQELIDTYVGILAERMLWGKWVIAEGAVFSNFSRDLHVKSVKWMDKVRPQVKTWGVGLDFGFTTNHPMAGALIGEGIDGFYHVKDFKVVKQVIDKAWVDSFLVPFCGPAKEVFCDSARPDLISQLDGFLAPHGIRATGVSKGPGSVVAGINYIDGLFKNQRYFIGENCTDTIAEEEAYRWKTDSSGQVKKEEPVPENDHLMDAKRYRLADKITSQFAGYRAL